MTFRILHITLAFLVFVSSAGFTLNSHFCQNTLQSAAIFFIPENCHERATHCAMNAVKSCCSKDKNTCSESEDKDCCEDKSQFAKADIDLKPFNTNEFQIDLLVVLSPIIPIHFETILTDKLIRFNNYILPPLIRNIPVLFQSFLC